MARKTLRSYPKIREEELNQVLVYQVKLCVEYMSC